jgi:hypothetical protein
MDWGILGAWAALFRSIRWRYILIMQRFAQISSEFQKQGLKWLVLEDDPLGTGGWFIYLHESLEAPCKFDNWYESEDLALSHAEQIWNVKPEDWQTLPGGRNGA